MSAALSLPAEPNHHECEPTNRSEMHSEARPPLSGTGLTSTSLSGTEPIDLATTCRLLNRTRSDVVYLLQRGYLAGEKTDGRWRIDPVRVLEYREDEACWISHDQAAELTGLSLGVIKFAAANGLLSKRTINHARPSLSIASVLAYGLVREQQARRQAALTFAQALQLTAGADEWAPPPDPDGTDPWLPPTTAALILGCCPSLVRDHARTERLPATRRGQRWWLRRSHVEMAAASRAFTQQQSAAS